VARQAGGTAAGVETEQAKMAVAVAGIMCCCFGERGIKQLQFTECCVVLHQFVRLQYMLKNCVGKEQNEIVPSLV
jgi:hypothetical protein